MRTRSRVGLSIVVLAGAAAAMLPAASAQNDPAPRVDVFREQSAADLPRVTLPRGVVEAASAYQTYLRNAASIRAAFRDGEAVNQAMSVGEAYQPAQMEEGLHLIAQRLRRPRLAGEVTWRPFRAGAWGLRSLPIRFEI